MHLLFGRKGISKILVSEDVIIDHISLYLARHVGNIKLFHMVLEYAYDGGLHFVISDKILRYLELLDNSSSNKEEKQIIILWRLYFVGKIYKETISSDDISCWHERFNKENGKLTPLLREELHHLLEPKIKVSLRYPLYISENKTISCSVVTNYSRWNIYDNRIPLESFEEILEDALKLYNLLKDNGFKVEASRIILPSIEEHPQNYVYDDRYGEHVLILLLRDAWKALYQNNKEEAGRVAQKWWKKPDIIFKRLALFAAGQGAIDSSVWVEWILKDDASYLWAKEGEYKECKREIMRLLTHKGKNLSGEIQDRLEEVILDRKEKNEIWLRLKKLEVSGLKLGEKAKKCLEKLSKQNPSW